VADMRMPDVAYVLSADRRTLVVKRRTPAGILTATFRRQKDAGPFTSEAITAALGGTRPRCTRMQNGQRNITRRALTRPGTLWTHVMLGPPTWWLPRMKREKDGTVMAGWLRVAVAAKFERSKGSTNAH
jgi:hypothetical protein